MNLNTELYKRFGLEIELNKTQKGFCVYVRNLLLEDLNPLLNPDHYKEAEELYKLRNSILREACRQTFEDYNNYKNSVPGFKWFIEHVFANPIPIASEFPKYLLNLQILLNIINDHKFAEQTLNKLSQHISEHLEDYPILGIKLKTYKIKPPQLLPTISKFMDKKIDNVLGLLEQKKYKSVLDNFEDGLKEFLIAKKKSELKDVIEDMCASCDELAKIIFKDNNKGFKHVFTKDEYKTFGFSNKNSKEIYRNLKDWMDGIKHGTLKQFEREDVEMIITLVASFIRFSINKNT